MTIKKLASTVVLIAAPMLPLFISAADTTDDVRSTQGVTVHEWGTFTSIAGPEGNAMNWMPAGGPTDLPCFVALTDTAHLKVVEPGPSNLSGGRSAQGTIRMETPVLYFYSPHESTVNVHVAFPHGLITEWYPSIARVGPDNPAAAMNDLSRATGTIEWDNVKIVPGAPESFLTESAPSHYYAARRTGSDPLQVGTQQEKFLFYRGIASFQPPIAARVLPDGTIQMTNLGVEVIPSIVLFENRGGKFGYRIVREFDRQATMELPELTSDFSSLQKSLEGILRAQGMYAAEATAMVDTWKDSWFEQGTRIFYIVPSRSVDAILPLSIDPQPAHVARAFVGRMEVITAATANEVRTALQSNDLPVLETYGRFLEPIVKNFESKMSDAEHIAALNDIAAIRAKYIAGVSACTVRRAR